MIRIVKQMNEAVDLVRRQENKALRADGDDQLAGIKYLWLYGEDNIPPTTSTSRPDALRCTALVEPEDGACVGAQGIVVSPPEPMLASGW